MKRFRPWVWAPAAVYGIVTCAWPLIGNRSYRAITGPKADMWLQSTVSLQAGVVASVLVRADLNDRVTPEITDLVLGASAGIAGVEIVNVARRRIPPASLIDAGGHLALVALIVDGNRRHGHSDVATCAAGALPSLVWRSQVASYAVGCLWPLLGAKSFQRVTGPKRDMWLVSMVALLLGSSGIAIGRAGMNHRITPEIVQLAVGTGASLAGVGVVNVARGRISSIYLADALAHITLVAGWLVAFREHLIRNRDHHQQAEPFASLKTSEPAADDPSSISLTDHPDLVSPMG